MIFKNYFVEKNLINNFDSLFSDTPLSAPKLFKRPLSGAWHLKCTTALLVVFAGTNQLYFFEIYINGVNKS